MTRPVQPDLEMSLGDHLTELRSRLIRSLLAVLVGLGVSLAFGMRIVVFLSQPVLWAMQENGFEPVLLAPGVGAPFAIYVKVSLIIGFILASPYVFWEFWGFVSVGLYPRERRWVHFFAPFTVLLFLAGVVFCYMVAIRYGLAFMASVARSMNDMGLSLRYEPSLYDSVNMILNFSLIMGLVFQLPVVLFFLTMTGLVEIRTLRKGRRYFLLAAFIIAAVLTPSTDAVTQTIMAVPLVLLYELGIQASALRRWLQRKEPAG